MATKQDKVPPGRPKPGHEASTAAGSPDTPPGQAPTAPPRRPPQPPASGKRVKGPLPPPVATGSPAGKPASQAATPNKPLPPAKAPPPKRAPQPADAAGDGSGGPPAPTPASAEPSSPGEGDPSGPTTTDSTGARDNEATIRPGDVVAGKYRVDRIVGYGGMGFVVEAWHLNFEERVAVKLLRKEVISNTEALVRFEREARSAFKIKSEHVARVIDVGRLDNGAPYMVMEFLEGTDLGALLAERRVLPVSEAVDYVLQAAEAIAEAHSLGIIHRDLKPENLFLCERRDGSLCVKVLDFGLSKVLPKQPASPRERSLTATKQVMGTAEYMSPEQWMSARDVGPPTDMWSLGVILFELLTGNTPFERDQMAQMCQAILGGEPPSLQALRPDAPAEIVPVILGCLEKDPAQRSNVADFATAVAPFGPPNAAAAAKRIVSLSRHQGRTDSDTPPSSDTAQRVSASPISSQPASGASAPVAAASEPTPSSGVAALPRVTSPRSWAKILQERPQRKAASRSGRVVGGALVALIVLVLGAIVWTNRHALNEPPETSPTATATASAPGADSPSAATTTATAAAATARPTAPSPPKPKGRVPRRPVPKPPGSP